MNKENIDFSFHCENCQSFPDRYTCIKTKKECPWVYKYNPTWEKHPCKYFYGSIKEYHHDLKTRKLHIFNREIAKEGENFYNILMNKDGKVLGMV